MGRISPIAVGRIPRPCTPSPPTRREPSICRSRRPGSPPPSGRRTPSGRPRRRRSGATAASTTSTSAATSPARRRRPSTGAGDLLVDLAAEPELPDVDRRPGARRLRRPQHRVRRHRSSCACPRATSPPSRSSSPTTSTAPAPPPSLASSSTPARTARSPSSSASRRRTVSTSLVVPVVQVRAAPAARVRYLGVNELADTAWLIGHQQARGDRDSDTTLATVALGGHYARVRTEARPRRRRRQHPPGRALLRRRRTRCTTSARSRTTTPRTRPATCCSRAPCRTSRAASTPA